MSRETDAHRTPTRRQRLKYGGAVAGGGLLAGCTGDDGSESTTAASATTAETETTAGDETTTERSSYSVTMEPVGRVEFETPPERWLAFTGEYADMGVALGQADGLAAVGVPSASRPTITRNCRASPSRAIP